MSKKGKILIITILLLAVSSIFTLVKPGEISIVYLGKWLLGDYVREIQITNSANHSAGKKTAYCNGIYYVYDPHEKGIINLDTDEMLLELDKKPERIAISENYIYVAFTSEIYQYDYSGNKVADFKLKEDAFIDQMAVIGDNLYCKMFEKNWDTQVPRIYINDAKNISKAGEYKDAGEMQELWLEMIPDQKILKVETTDEYVKIYTGNSDASYCAHLEDAYMEELDISSDEYDVVKTTVSGNHFLLSLEKFYKEPRWGGPSPYKEIGYLESGRVLSVNLEDYSTVSDIDVAKGKVVYMDEKKYALLKGKNLVFYSLDDGQQISKERIEKLNRWKDWEVEVSGNRLFFSCDGEIVDWVEVNKTEVAADDITPIIQKALRIQYGWGTFSGLEEISTEGFAKTAERDIIYLGRRFYSVEKDYLEHIEKISDDVVEVTVCVYSPDILIHKFILKQTEDGRYLIDNIEHDI